MKKVQPFVFLALTLFAVGCSNSTTIKTPDGEVTVSGDGKTTVATGPNGEKFTMNSDGKNFEMKDDKGNTITGNDKGWTSNGPDGKSTISTNSVTEAELGLPFYPGSTEVPGSIKTDTPEGQSVMASRTTNDLPDKVKEFYTPKLAKVETSNSATNDGVPMMMIGGSLADGAQVTIMATKSKENTLTSIIVTVVHKKKA